MNSSVTVHDRTFELFLSPEEIQQRVKEISEEIEKDWKDKNPLFLCVLNGAVYFAADLTRHFSFNCEMSCVKVASYDGMKSGKIKSLIGLTEDVSGRAVIILEDIVDTGRTLTHIYELLSDARADTIVTAAFLFKSDALVGDVRPYYTGYEVPNHFMIGYGMDYNKQGRNLPAIYKLKN